MTYKAYPLFLIFGLYKQNRVITEQNWQFLEKLQISFGNQVYIYIFYRNEL